jgi:LPPG:FO 2-phospho-L-lactate transferase
VALSGGVGGAKLVDGLAAVLPAEALTVIVNTGDDFVHWGLNICPDLDTVVYTLAGLAHPEQGWGLAGETFGALAMVERLGGPAWFRLGDHDLGTHLFRSSRLAADLTLTEVTAEIARALGIGATILPMADVARPTQLETPEGTLGFQDWLVARRGAPSVSRVWWPGPATPAPGVIDAIAAADVVVIGPSNPYVSIDPILALDGVRDAIAHKLVLAVSPIVDGRAVKGPLAPMIERLAGRAPSAAAIADHYAPLLRGLVIERGDAAPDGIQSMSTSTIMHTREHRAALAREVLAFAEVLA